MADFLITRWDFDFKTKAGYCRNGFPANNGEWAKVNDRVLTDDLIKKIQPYLRDKIPSFSQKSILHRLTIILVEMVSNVVKHAYETSDKTFAGIYIRFRNGLDNN